MFMKTSWFLCVFQLLTDITSWLVVMYYNKSISLVNMGKRYKGLRKPQRSVCRVFVGWRHVVIQCMLWLLNITSWKVQKGKKKYKEVQRKPWTNKQFLHPHNALARETERYHISPPKPPNPTHSTNTMHLQMTTSHSDIALSYPPDKNKILFNREKKTAQKKLSVTPKTTTLPCNLCATK